MTAAIRLLACLWLGISGANAFAPQTPTLYLNGLQKPGFNGQLQRASGYNINKKPLLPRRIDRGCALTAQLPKQGGGDKQVSPPSDLPAKGLVWTVWAIYNYIVFFSDKPCGAAGGDLCGVGLPTITEAINLSINFWFVTPLVAPSLAPVVHPALEGLFNIVIAFGALFLGFLSDGRGQRIAMLPFMVGTAFLTNVFYLPYLGIRRPYQDASAAAERGEGEIVPKQQLDLAESKGLPALMVAVFALSVAWGMFGRSDGGFGDVGTRWSALVDMATHTDRLAHSFMVDCLAFWAFQGWLVPDDMRRRGKTDATAEVIARGIPFFGLAWYLWTRPPLPDRDA